jgi:hypothetical protein
MSSVSVVVTGGRSGELDDKALLEAVDFTPSRMRTVKISLLSTWRIFKS